MASPADLRDSITAAIAKVPDKPVTKKPAETRMGSGKGNPEFWVAVVRPGRVMFELSFPNDEQARIALNKAIQKLPIKARILTRNEQI